MSDLVQRAANANSPSITDFIKQTLAPALEAAISSYSEEEREKALGYLMSFQAMLDSNALPCPDGARKAELASVAGKLISLLQGH